MLRAHTACPPHVEEVADSYCLHQMSEEASRAFERHLITCPRCAQAVENAQEFIDVLWKAAREAGELPRGRY